MKILFEDSFMVVTEKPVNMPSQPDKTGDLDLTSVIVEKTGYAAIINRLDRGVGGIVIFALNKWAAAALSKQHNTDFIKKYTAVVCGIPEKNAELTNWLIKNERTNMSRVVNERSNGASLAGLKYTLKDTAHTIEYGKLSAINVTLLTGRHHQIRVQLMTAGIPLWGDTKYNEGFHKGGALYKAAKNADAAINPALWASLVGIRHPKTGESLSFESKPQGYPFNLFDLSQYNAGKGRDND